MRSALMTRSRMVTSPVPSTLRGRASRRTTCGCSRKRSSAESSIVTIRSSRGSTHDKALSNVVFPLPVPPDTAMLFRARTAHVRQLPTVAPNEPVSIMSPSVITREANLRMVSTGPSTASGGMITCTRWPWGRRAFAMGDASSTRRPSGPSMRSMSALSCASSENRASERNRRPSRSKNTSCGPFTMISVTVSSARSPSRGPNPNTASTSSSASRCRSSRGTVDHATSSNT